MDLQNSLAAGLSHQINQNTFRTPSPHHRHHPNPLEHSSQPSKQNKSLKKKGISLTKGKDNPLPLAPAPILKKRGLHWCGGQNNQHQTQLHYTTISAARPVPQSPQLDNFICNQSMIRLESRIVQKSKPHSNNFDVKRFMNGNDSNLAKSTYEDIIYNPKRSIIDRRSQTTTKKSFYDHKMGETFSSIMDVNPRLSLNSYAKVPNKYNQSASTSQVKGGNRWRSDTSSSPRERRVMKKSELSEYRNTLGKTEYSRN